MKQEEWTKQLRDKLADHEESAPADLWAGIEARLQQEGAAESSVTETHQPSARLIPLWGKRIAVAAAFIGVLICNGYLMWEIGQNEKAQRGETNALEASAPSMKSEKPEHNASVNLQNSPNSSGFMADASANTVVTKKVRQHTSGAETDLLLSQNNTPETDAAPMESPKTADDVVKKEEKEPVSSEKHAQEPQRALPSQEEQLRQLDAKIAEATKKAKRGHVGFSLYAQGGKGNQMSANGVMMSPTMADNYNYSHYLPTRHFTRSGYEVIYLVDYEERQKHYQPVSFGLTANIPISSRMSLTTGLVYTRLRSEFVNIMGNIPLTKKQTLQYLGVPVNVQYKLWGHKGLSVYAAAGGQADYNVKAHMEQEGVDYPVSRDRWQFSVQASAGVEYDVIPQIGIYVEPGVKRYFDNGSNVSNFFKDKPTSFNLQVGIRVNLGTQK